MSERTYCSILTLSSKLALSHSASSDFAVRVNERIFSSSCRTKPMYLSGCVCGTMLNMPLLDNISLASITDLSSELQSKNRSSSNLFLKFRCIVLAEWMGISANRRM
jgi:hypothetical protein